MKNKKSYFLLFVLLAFIACSPSKKSIEPIISAKPEIGTVYSRVYKFIEYGEYNLAFSELKDYLRFYSPEERIGFDIQNIFAKYIIEGNDSLENIIENYVRLFDFFDSSDAESVYQMIMYRSSNESNLERAALIVAQKADNGSSEAGLYFFLAYTFYNLKMREQADKYLDCLINIAPQHPATANLMFRIRGKKPNYRAFAVEALRTLYYRDKSPSVLGLITSNFHIPSMINKEWENIAQTLIDYNLYNVQLISYSEIPIFFARNNNGEALYNLLKKQILANNYRLFSLVMRSLLYVYKEPYVIVDRLKREFINHPFVLMLQAQYLVSLSSDNIMDAAQLCINALEKSNNIEIFFDSVEIFRKTSEMFKLKSFAEELLFKYPYYRDLYNIYKIISSNTEVEDIFPRYFEHISESVEKYMISSNVMSDLSKKREYILNGLRIYKGDCSLILELLNIESSCEAGDFSNNYKAHIKDYVMKDEILFCINKMDEKRQKVYLSLVNEGRKDECADKSK